MSILAEIPIGPMAGIATSVFWTGTALLFTAASRRLGATLVNGARIGIAIVLLAVTQRCLAGVWIPPALPRQYLLLAASGVIGLTIGDQALFSAFVRIGPRLAMLMMTTSPLMAAIFGWVALSETLTPLAIVGILLTLGGVGWVVLERPGRTTPTADAARWSGILLALLGAACQAGGMLLSKQGIGHGWLPDNEHLDPQAATLVRMFFAGVGVVPLFALHWLRHRRRQPTRPTTVVRDARSRGWLFTFLGACVGPYLGVWMSLIAIDRAPLGIGQTLCSLSPVFILPFSVWIHGEKLSVRAVVGAIVAVGGSTLLFLTPTG